MNKPLLRFQYRTLLELYCKLRSRLRRSMTTGNFYKLTRKKRAQLIARLEKLKIQLLRKTSDVKLSGVALSLSALLLATQAQAQSTPAGTEFLVNTTTVGGQSHMDIAMDPSGNFVIAWISDEQDGDGEGIYAQRFNASGTAQGSEFKVNTTTTGDQEDPSIAMDANGNFVITWQGPDATGDGIYGQRYNASGVAQGSEFVISTATTADQYDPDVAMDADGDFVVTWTSDGQDGSASGIYAQRFNASGVAQGSEFIVNTTTANGQSSQRVGMDNSGNFVVTWKSNGQDGDISGIYAQRYNASGVAQGSEFRANTTTAGEQESSDIALDADGDFVIAWESLGQDGGDGGVYAQRYNASGVAQGSEFRVNTYTTDTQDAPAVAMDDDGDFVISWRSYYQNGYGYDSYAQCFSADGTAKGSEFRANTNSVDEGYQFLPRVAMDSDGDFVITWWSYDQDGDETGIYAQRYNGGFTTSVDQNNMLHFGMYPNPAIDRIQIDLENNYDVRVLNLYGQVKLDFKNVSGTTLDVSSLTSGTYVIEITQNDQRGTQKVVIQ